MIPTSHFVGWLSQFMSMPAAILIALEPLLLRITIEYPQAMLYATELAKTHLQNEANELFQK
jgi:hypothetical protein